MNHNTPWTKYRWETTDEDQGEQAGTRGQTIRAMVVGKTDV